MLVALAGTPKIRGDLQQYLLSNPEGKKIPVMIEMAIQPDLKTMRGETGKAKADYLRSVEEATQSDLLEYLKSLSSADASKVHSFWIVNAISAELTPRVIEEIAERPDVGLVEPDDTFWIVDNETPPEGQLESPLSVEWNISMIKADSVWYLYGITGNGVIVGNLDTGVDITHPALQGKWLGYWFDGVNGQPNPYDDHGHGTHTMGIMVGGDGPGPFQNDIGVAPGANFVAAKGFSSSGSGETSWILACYEFFASLRVDSGVDVRVVSNSWGSCDQTNLTFWNATENWRELGIFPVFAIGNAPNCGYSEPPPYGSAITPGNFPIVIGVGATTSADEIASFSLRGPAPDQNPWNDTQYWLRPDWNLIKPDISAPGQNIRSSVPGGGYESWSGTSMATPHVAGVLALMLERAPSLTFEQAYNIILDNAHHVPSGEPYPNNIYGWGRIDALASVEATSPVQISHTPLPNYEEPQPNYPVIATITSMDAPLDPNQLFVYYAVNGGSFSQLLMTPTGNPDEYEADIPYQTPPAEVSYYIYAQDTLGNTATAPPNAPDNVYSFYIGPIETLFSYDVETGQGDWTHTNLTPAYYDQWHISTEMSHSPDHSWKCGDTGSGNYADSLDAVLVSPQIYLPDYGPKTLIFWHWMYAETSSYYIGMAYDGGLVEINDGSGWHEIYPKGGYPFVQRGGSGSPLPEGTPIYSGQIPWRQDTFDISDYSGYVQIRFHFASDQAVNYEGWYVDDIVVTGPPTGPTFIRGDVNADGDVTVNDVVNLANYLFGGGAAPLCEASADANHDGVLDAGDMNYLVSFLFQNGPPPDSPYPDCGVEPNPSLPCDSFPPCGW